MPELTENLIRLRSVPGVGNTIIWRLLKQFGDSGKVLAAGENELTAVKGVSLDLARRIMRAGSFDPRHEMDKAAAEGVAILPYDDPLYPKPLRHMFDPPVILYVRGRITEADQVAVGVVGTRRYSRYGKEHAINLSASLARGGYTIVSGLARGVDTFAHSGALQAGGRTIGVLGCGFDHMYPEENRDLALEMTRSGAVVTEFSMATPPSRDTFPVRNRIIAGMTMGLLVIEAPLRSGALITARMSNEIGRMVFAVPGRLDDARSEGCNKLIRDGAVMVTNVDDIFRELNPSLPMEPRESAPPAPRKASRPVREVRKPERLPVVSLNDDETVVLAETGIEWTVVDDIIERSGLASGKVVAALAMLRLKRLVEQGPGQMYRKRP